MESVVPTQKWRCSVFILYEAQKSNATEIQSDPV